MKKMLLGLLLATATAMPAAAVEVAKVQVPDTATLSDGTTLVLNGAGIRKKFIIKVYVGALYLPAKRTDAAAVIGSDEARRISMHFLYKKVEADKLRETWEEGFAGNASAAELSALRDRLEAFKGLFGDAVEGDTIVLDYIPGQGTSVTHNGQLAGSVEGADFAAVLASVWLGDKPADKGLKESMLGN